MTKLIRLSQCTHCCLRSVPKRKSHYRTFTLQSQTNTKNKTQEWRLIFEECGKKNNNTHKDWYQKPLPELLDDKSARIVDTQFNGSLYSALSTIFPEITWNPWQFKNESIQRYFWLQRSNQKRFFDWLGKEVGVKELDDWYSVLSQKLITQHGGLTVLSLHNGSAIAALKASYPEHNWIPWKFNFVPRGFWLSTENLRQYFDWLGNKLGVKELDDWYTHLSKKTLIDNCGGGLLSRYNGSPLDALKAAYPLHNWIPWKFNLTSQGFWQDFENHKQFMEWLGKKLGVKELDDWYSVLSAKAMMEYGGASLLWKYNGSPVEALKAVYPEHAWIPWKFNCISQGFWKSDDNKRKYFNWLASQLGVTHPDDWYGIINKKVMYDHYGGTLLTLHNGSPIDALRAAYPGHNWIPWKFNVANHGFWKSPENQRKFFDWLGEKLGVKHLDDWYDLLNVKVVTENGGSCLLNVHRGVGNALMAAYPEHQWNPWKFKMAVQGCWGEKQHVSKFVAELSERLSIHTLEDWYRVDVIQLRHFGAAGIIKKYNGLYNILKQQYPDYPWDPKKFQKGRKGQRWLVVTLKKMFPDEGNIVNAERSYCSEIIEDYVHAKSFAPSNRPMQLDVFIPSKSLAFEYQGIQHYQDVGVFGPTKQYQRRDEEKRSICAANNIKLIEVPYWWNRTEEGLRDIIKDFK